jgi:hypothetical protein
VTKTNWRGFGRLLVVMTILSMVFYLTTRVFWHLP